MKRFVIAFLLFTFALPAFASTHKENYSISCSELWRAVKDTLRNSGKYGIISITDSEMTASYNIGGNLTGKRMNTAILNSKDDGKGCELQIQTAYSGIVNNDAGDFKQRVDQSITKLKSEPLPEQTAASPSAPAAQASVNVESTPAGADIEIDGAFVGNTPSKINLTPGKHQVVVKKKGFSDWSRTLDVTGGTINLSADLEPAPTK